MNARAVSFWEKAAAGSVLLLAFLLPLAFYLKTYDSVMIKELTLQGGAALALAFTLLRHVESGRLEVPAGRVWLAGWAAALLVWIGVSCAAGPHPQAAFFGGARLAAYVLLFLLVLVGPASVSFAAALSDWMIGAAALASVYAIVQALGGDPLAWKGLFGTQAFSTLGHPDLLGVFLGLVFPLCLSRSADAERSAGGRGFARFASLACAFGLLASGSLLGLLTFAVSSFAFAAATLAFLPGDRAQGSGWTAAVAIPALTLAIFNLGGPGLRERAVKQWALCGEIWSGALGMLGENLWTGVGAGAFHAAYPAYQTPRLFELGGTHDFMASAAHSGFLRIACETGLIGLLLCGGLLVTVLVVAGRDLARRAREGEERSSLLMAGQWSALLGLAAAGAVGSVWMSPAPGVFLWLFAGSLAGLALERGSSTVRVIPIPASPGLRRTLYVPVAVPLVFCLVWQTRFAGSDRDLNFGLYSARRLNGEEALKRFDRVSPWHKDAAMARYLAGNIHLDRRTPRDLDRALELYGEVERIHPHYARVGLKKSLAYLQRGDWARSRDSVKRHIGVHPGDPDAYALLVEVSTILGEKDQALWAATQLVRYQPDEPAHWRLLAEQYRAQKRYMTARKMLDRAERVHDLAGTRTKTRSIY